MDWNDPGKLPTKHLTGVIKDAHWWTMTGAGLFGGFLVFLAAEWEYEHREAHLYLWAIMAVVAFAFTLGSHLRFTRRLLPELEARAGELAPTEEASQASSVEAFRRRQKLSKWGWLVLFLALPAGGVAGVLGGPFRDEDGLTVAGLAVVAPFFLVGMALLLRSAQCPSCDQLLHYRYHDAQNCPYCGTQLNE